METKKCPLCGGDMIKGKSPTEGYALYFWKAPWKKGFRGAIKGTVKAYPWLCLNCGAIIPYVGEDELQKVREEYEEARISGMI
ncbi:hypothetical protein K1720_00075 [Thermococcus argininiproducens]|uniref:Uncharacterized protein n=1 Tax=Thermococcus argininiproducens TaxID=2866384 RepID=A0A9E7M9R0_9EURY|nr:hypothetical protein [Thermococcus argininiproducens]USG99925.1 hypothetical protein K1720_00075 [Thermococcus argininiproducens]